MAGKEIPLTQGKVAIVDDADYERVSARTWWALRGYKGLWYAYTQERKNGVVTQLYMHRFVLDDFVSPRIDHEDHEGLNNRRGNLRPATAGQNAMNASRLRSHNRSGFMGVGWHAVRQKWRARLDRTHLGLFDDPIEAAKAYDAESRRVYGEFAYLNFPPLVDTAGFLEGLV